MKTIAVLSGDLINSSRYEASLLTGVIKLLKQEFLDIISCHPKTDITFSIYRGDSFQGVIEDPKIALAAAMQIKTAVTKYIDKKEGAKNKAPLADIRISIGVGKAIYQKKVLEESNGEAFQFSGRTLDAMKSEGSKMALTTSNLEINEEFKVSFKFLDAITDRWSTASAEVVHYLLKGHTEQQIANKLKRSQTAIHLRKKAAGWEEIQLLLKRYEQVAQKYFV